MTWDNNKMSFIHDAIGPAALIFNGTTYYYTRNAQGDITGIVGLNEENEYEQVVSYSYNAWGKVWLSGEQVFTLGIYNPFTYRGYVMDLFEGLYYLQSRYYSSVLGRFINADTPDVLSASPDSATWDKNLYAYCDNNPVIRKDDGGQFWTIASGLLIGAVISGGIELGMQLMLGKPIDIGNIALAAMGGAVSGVLAATGLGFVGQAIGNAAVSGVSEAISQVKSGNRNIGSIALNAGGMALVGAASTIIGGKGIKAKGSNYRASLDTLGGLKDDVTKALTDPQGYKNQINAAIANHQHVTNKAMIETTGRFGGACLFTNLMGRVKSWLFG